ncbi:MAG: amidohydrolase family protein [Oscillospiraceae bacterium]
MIIDFHTHAFPDGLAERAIKKMHISSGLFPHTDGTVDGLRRLMRHDGVDLAVILPVATNPKKHRHINDFAVTCRGNGVLSFGSVHPDAPDVLDELDRIHAMGFKGIKFHPEYQGFTVDDEKMKPIYRKISELGLITVFHVGPDFSYHPPYHGTAKQMLGALKWLDSPVVAAHWGGIDKAEEALSTLSGIPQLYLDTALGYGTNVRTFVHEFIDTFGADHILFGSDTPWHPPEWELRLFETLNLDPETQEAIFSGNAKRLLKL